MNSITINNEVITKLKESIKAEIQQYLKEEVLNY